MFHSFRRLVSLFSFLSLVLLCSTSHAESVLEITLEVPEIDAEPYHRPYIAIWLETPEREAINTLSVWHEKDTWLKDMRQWWRKLGRSGKENLDGISGATRKPGSYTIAWDGLDSDGKKVSQQELLLNIESVREEGGRSYLRQAITIGKKATIQLDKDNEVGPIQIKVY